MAVLRTVMTLSFPITLATVFTDRLSDRQLAEALTFGTSGHQGDGAQWRRAGSSCHREEPLHTPPPVGVAVSDWIAKITKVNAPGCALVATEKDAPVRTPSSLTFGMETTSQQAPRCAAIRAPIETATPIAAVKAHLSQSSNFCRLIGVPARGGSPGHVGRLGKWWPPAVR